MNEEKIEKAWEEIDNGKITDGINLLNDVLLKSPNDWKVHYNIGQAYKLHGDYEKSINSLSVAKELDNEGYICNYLGLAEVYLIVSEFDNAILNLKDVFLSKHPVNEQIAGIINGMGITLTNNNEFEKAKEVYEQAEKMLWNVVFTKIRQSSDYPNKYVVRTVNNESEVDLDKAFTEFFKMDPLCCQLKNNLGVCLAELAFLDEAKEKFKESILYTPDEFAYQAPIIALKEIDDMQKTEKEIFNSLGYKEDEISESGKIILSESGWRRIFNKRKKR